VPDPSIDQAASRSHPRPASRASSNRSAPLAGAASFWRPPCPRPMPGRLRRRATWAGIATRIGNHTSRATGITAYRKNGGTPECTATMANHASMRTRQLYERRSEDITLDEVEHVLI
jgi:integrase